MVTETKTEHPHVVRVKGEAGEKAVMVGTNLSVWWLIRQLRAGDTPEIIAAEFSHASIAAIYDAISYYYDHRSEIDPIIEDADRRVAEQDAADDGAQVRRA